MLVDGSAKVPTPGTRLLCNNAVPVALRLLVRKQGMAYTTSLLATQLFSMLRAWLADHGYTLAPARTFYYAGKTHAMAP